VANIYFFGIRLFALFIRLASFWNVKAKKWVDGQSGLFEKIENSLEPGTGKRFWFHASSLGEYELCKPLIRELKKGNKNCHIVVTFFSPSGFEGKGTLDQGDSFFYLPLDTPGNVKRLLNILNPDAAFFAKNDLWYFYLTALQERKIFTVLFSANFRDEQFYFKWYGRFLLKRIKGFDKIFVQGQGSKTLLEGHGIGSAVVGDSRFDRVAEIVKTGKEYPEIADFIGVKKSLVVGSLWPSDLNQLLPALDKFPEIKVVLAPHDISEVSVTSLETKLGKEAIRYSRFQSEEARTRKFLIIDNIGMLSSLYRYGSLAYVGGGFLEGLHNILEPAAWGLPVLFGPRLKKFPEAYELINWGGGFMVRNSEEVKNILERLLDKKTGSIAGEKARLFVEESKGSIDKIMKELDLL
jgi:3-deoxy-D-manno-octulosonic-acid transferase